MRCAGVVSLVLLIVCASRAGGTGSDAGDTRALLAEATAAVERGLSARDLDPDGGQREFLEAANLYARLIDQHGIENHALHASRGSALLLGGDVGRAVAALRRAERLDPTDQAVRAGLDEARRRVGVSVERSTRGRVQDALLAWRGYVDRRGLLGVAMGAHAVVWIAVAIRAAGRRWATRAAVVAACVGAIAAAPLVVESALTPVDEGVIVATSVVGFNGPSPVAYAPTFESPLMAGIECRVLERRDDWVRIELASDDQTWVPADSVEML